jgi:hypothetical protein
MKVARSPRPYHRGSYSRARGAGGSPVPRIYPRQKKHPFLSPTPCRVFSGARELVLSFGVHLRVLPASKFYQQNPKQGERRR